MKSSTLHATLTAKALFDEAHSLVDSGNVYSCSAGLVLLQDAVELIVLGLLGEIGVDEAKNLEKKSFDELLGELKNTGTPMPKIGTVKALNKQRVITKHYGQLAQPDTVRNYFVASNMLVGAALRHVLGKSIDEILVTELLPECEAKTLLDMAIEKKDQGDYLGCLIDVRRAFYVEYEQEYAIHRWADAESSSDGLFAALARGGMKAPYYTRSKDWIEKNVKTPGDYVQVDLNTLRSDSLEWGVSTSLVENIMRLTPQVFRPEKDSEWRVEYDRHFPANEANEANCNYCLDGAISILGKKKEHEQARRWPRRERFDAPKTIYIGRCLYKLARADSEVVHEIQEGFVYNVSMYVSGFLEGEQFLHVSGNRPPNDENEYGSDFVRGYLLDEGDNEEDPG
ncbi:hypothetical protein EYC98_21170 [Halieaceae bacterium IMCC14734]|uniref:Uncharacterized protein n=1 Tax=Candidatus Litorirhabdus singularis TaxID=2518993 RepID=A0ABT3TM24_9GAMM|nr:hypothetical protein [Candidatus Litorirhabdus singularis]MCX2983379.1 hypothetical protein [Candidatus Litorirhabdus singularis]